MRLTVSSVVIASLFICSAAAYELPNGGQIWALLVAGSSEYDNYRHQADVCHAYQILHGNGIPDENIIVMMFDDIAHNAANPTPGIIINRPNGTDVYKGVPKDYTGMNVNSTNFLKVLAGDDVGMKGIGSGRVIKSGPNDHIFVNFVDHGAPGLLAFPNEELYAPKLEAVLKNMSFNNQFSKMVLYVEACESGSMFESILPLNWNIFVTTAADPRESSYACYYDELRQTYLGDVFSVKWMEDSEEENILVETLHEQYEVVRAETNTSHVEEYGNLDIGSMHVADFLGFQMSADQTRKYQQIPDDAVHNRNVVIAILELRLQQSKDPAEQERIKFELRKILKSRRHLEKTVQEILMETADGKKLRTNAVMTSRTSLTLDLFPCYQQLTQHFSNKCYKLSKNPHALSLLYMFVNLCAQPWLDEDVAMAAMDKVCSENILPHRVI